MDAAALVRRTRAALAETEARIRTHPWLDALERGEVSRRALAAFAGEQLEIIPSDRRSFSVLAGRHPDDPAGPYFIDMVAGEEAALEALESFAAAVGLTGARRRRYEPIPGCQAYPAYVAWLARDGGPAEVATAFLVNLEAWGANCARMRDALRDRYELPGDAVAFFDLFASAPPGFAGRCIEVAGAALASEEHAARAARAARLLQAYELLYWDSLPD